MFKDGHNETLLLNLKDLSSFDASKRFVQNCRMSRLEVFAQNLSPTFFYKLLEHFTVSVCKQSAASIISSFNI